MRPLAPRNAKLCRSLKPARARGPEGENGTGHFQREVLSSPHACDHTRSACAGAECAERFTPESARGCSRALSLKAAHHRRAGPEAAAPPWRADAQPGQAGRAGLEAQAERGDDHIRGQPAAAGQAHVPRLERGHAVHQVRRAARLGQAEERVVGLACARARARRALALCGVAWDARAARGACRARQGCWPVCSSRARRLTCCGRMEACSRMCSLLGVSHAACTQRPHERAAKGCVRPAAPANPCESVCPAHLRHPDPALPARSLRMRESCGRSGPRWWRARARLHSPCPMRRRSASCAPGRRAGRTRMPATRA